MRRYGAGMIEPQQARQITGSDPEAMMREAAEAISQTLAVQWKRETIVHSGEGARLRASVAFSDLAEWQTIRRRLDRVSFIKESHIVAVSSGGAQIEVDYAGTLDTLALGLKQQNLQLTETGGPGGQWVVSLIR